MSDNVVDLDEHKSQRSPLEKLDRALPPGTPKQKIDQILARQDAPEYLQNLDAHVFFRLIKSAGWDQSYDLIQYATPRQVQNFIDFDCWTRDRLVVPEMKKWFGALVSESSDEHLRSVCRNMDPEVLAYFFKDNLEVEPVEDGKIPDNMEGNVALSPDNQYAILYPDDEDMSAVLRSLIDRLYGADRMLGWTVLEAVRWELPSELEEYAYKWRTSRLEEFGFVPREEAIEIYQYVAPTEFRDKIDAGQQTDVVDLEAPNLIDPPELLEDELTEEFFFTEALNGVEDGDTNRQTIYQLIGLLHRAMMADGIEPGDIESGRQVIRRTLGYLSLGLQFLSRQDLQSASELLDRLTVKRIFQVGFSLTRKVQNKLESLETNPSLSLIEGERFSLLNEDEQALATALKRRRPGYAEDALTYEIFKSQDQLDKAAARIGVIAFKQLWLFGLDQSSLQELIELIYSDKVINSPPSISFDVLLGTSLSQYLLTDAPTLKPLSPDQLEKLPDLMRKRPWSDAESDDYWAPLFEDLHDRTQIEATHPALQWTDDVLGRLESELSQIRSVDRPEYFAEMMLVSLP